MTDGLDPLSHTLGFVPGQVLRLFGMRRSGNHAITHWLQRNAPSGHSVFLNNCKPTTDPFKTFRSIELDGEHAPHRKAMKDLASVTGGAGDGAMLLFSYEDVTPAEFIGGRDVSGRFDERLLTGNVIVYRSFLNWAASLLKKMQGNSSYSLLRRNAILLQAIDIYTRLLGLVEQAETLKFTCICYDKWVRDPAYRGQVLAQLGLPMRDNSLGRVQAYGGGSSFQSDAQNPDQLQISKRWHQMAEDPEFQAVLQLAAHDTGLTSCLERLFPRDAALLARIARDDGMPREVTL